MFRSHTSSRQPARSCFGRGAAALGGVACALAVEVGSLLIPATSCAKARAAAASPAASAPLGGLRRTAAVIESTLDIHRLALVELAAAAHKVLEAGMGPEATPTSPLPAPAAEVLARLAKSLPLRVPADALPAVSRAYEAEAVEALEELGRAATLGRVVRPLQAYTLAVRRLLGEADEVIDLYSRARPIETRVVDPDSMLDEVDEALDELARAEAGVTRTRERRRPLGEQLQTFLRLEIALGHALDLIAEAQESGIYIGFEAPMSTAGLTATASSVRSHLAALTPAVQRMQQPPAPLAPSLAAVVSSATDGPPYEAHLHWRAPQGEAQPAAVRIYRQPNKRQSLAFLTDLLACESGDRAAAEQSARTRLEEMETTSTLTAELPPGRGSFGEQIAGPARLFAPPRYRVVPVNAFGVEGSGPEVIAVYVPRSVEGPPHVAAELASRNPAAPSFYEEGDLVRIRWSPSRNELPAPVADLDLEAWAEEQKLPVVRGYRVLRRVGDAIAEVTVTAAGVHEATDRPSASALATGVSYYVEAVTDYGRGAQAPKPCVATEIRTDLQRALEVAAAGIAHVRHPTSIERRALERLRDPSELHRALSAFAARAAAERETLLESWWTSLRETDRLALLQAWPDYVSERSRADWLAEGLDRLTERDRPWVMTELWLVDQPPYVQAEIERWWTLLDGDARTRAIRDWRRPLDAAHDRYVAAQLETGDETVLRPAKVLAWWSSRDSGERERIEDHWLGLESSRRSQLFRDWLADQPAVVRTAVRWPDLGQRTAKERAALLTEAYRDLPDGLMVHVLAWLDWHTLRGEELRKAIAQEIGWWRHVTSRARYWLRPVDRAVGFHLMVITASLGILTPAALLVGRLRRRSGVPTIR